jgi:PKHD-type hydroxylase
MLYQIEAVLGPDELDHMRHQLDGEDWEAGRRTAGREAMRSKNNLQLQEDSSTLEKLRGMVTAALLRNGTFVSAAFPKAISPPLFNRYDAGMAFGAHIDNALRGAAGGLLGMRCDISATLFLSDPEEYEGGELVIEGTVGAQRIKLGRGNLLIYPASSVHQVAPVTRGSRLAAVFWVQSAVRESGKRDLLVRLDAGIQQLRTRAPQDPALTSLAACYHELLRMWADV